MSGVDFHCLHYDISSLQRGETTANLKTARSLLASHIALLAHSFAGKDPLVVALKGMLKAGRELSLKDILDVSQALKTRYREYSQESVKRVLSRIYNLLSVSRQLIEFDNAAEIASGFKGHLKRRSKLDKFLDVFRPKPALVSTRKPRPLESVAPVSGAGVRVTKRAPSHTPSVEVPVRESVLTVAPVSGAGAAVTIFIASPSEQDPVKTNLVKPEATRPASVFPVSDSGGGASAGAGVPVVKGSGKSPSSNSFLFREGLDALTAGVIKKLYSKSGDLLIQLVGDGLLVDVSQKLCELQSILKRMNQSGNQEDLSPYLIFFNEVAPKAVEESLDALKLVESFKGIVSSLTRLQSTYVPAASPTGGPK